MQPRTARYISHSAEETRAIAFQLGSTLPKNSVIAFFGELGAGKTTFIKGLVPALADCHPDEVSSPTFTYLNIYHGPTDVYHFDLYRLADEAAFLSMGFDEYLAADGVCVVEWSEKIASLIPKSCLRISLKHLAEEMRAIEIHWGTPA